MTPATAHEVRESLGFYSVPCNGCTRCCHNDAVRILPHEDASRWLTEAHPTRPGARMLAHKANGDCVYLGEAGCTRQDDKPQICHEMDCRRLAQAISFTKARKMHEAGRFNIAIWHRGRELLREGGTP